MSSFQSLPNEILLQIVGRLTCRRDIGNLRLVNRNLDVIAKGPYFASVALYPHWEDDEEFVDDDPPWPNGIEYDVAMFKHILDDEGVKPLVKSVDIYTCNPDCDHQPTWVHGYNGDSYYDCTMPQRAFAMIWDDCIDRLPELPNLNSVSLIFDRHGANDQEDDYDNEMILQTRGRRHKWLENTFRLMGSRIKHLGLRHFQDIICAPWLGTSCCSTHRSPDDAIKSECAFAKSNTLRESILEGLESLQMTMVHEQPRGESGSLLEITDIHQCWHQFPSRWLIPASSNLKKLELYSDVAVGWWPKLDLRGVHFPQLQSLNFGHFIFSRDQQFDWIVSHGQTLRELFFDHCSILYQVGHSEPSGENALDEERCPRRTDHARWSNFQSMEGMPPHFFSYSTRWHQVFSRFSENLPKLTTIKFGSSSQWNFDTPNRRDDGDPGLPIVPWRAQNEMRNEMFERRYVVFSGWTERYRPSWKKFEPVDIDEPDDTADDSAWEAYWKIDHKNRNLQRADEEEPDMAPQMEERPECDEEDSVAFQALLRKIGQP